MAQGWKEKAEKFLNDAAKLESEGKKTEAANKLKMAIKAEEQAIKVANG